MPTTETLYAVKSAAVNYLYNDHDSANFELNIPSRAGNSQPRDLLIGFEQPAQQNRSKIISGIVLYVHGETTGEKLTAYSLIDDFNDTDFYDYYKTEGHQPGSAHSCFTLNETSYSNQLKVFRFPDYSYYSISYDGHTSVTKGVFPFFSKLIKYGVDIYTSNSNSILYGSKAGQNKPYIVVTYSDYNISTKVSGCSPASGYISKHVASTFSWNLIADGNVGDGYYYELPQISNAVFQYKYSSSGTVTEIQCGAVNSKTIPAETFTGDTVFWRVKITNTLGTDNYSDWMQLNTVEATSSAVAISPKNIMADGSAPIKFEWNHIISTGTAQTAAELQKSQNASSWTTLATVEGPETSTEIPAGTFSAGQWYWRVRTYNSDDTAGTWSDPVSFIVVSAPDRPAVATNGTPRPTVSWQASGQQGYQVSIVKAETSESVYDSGTVFGTANSMKLPKYLDDGAYVAKVRVVNNYSLWSEYGTAALTVANTPGEDITLTVNTEDNAAQLSWTTEEEYDAFIVYRDGVPVSKSPEVEYTDYYSAGEHRYFVRGVYNDSDYYGVTDTITVTVEVETLTVIDTETNNTMVLKLSENSMRTISVYEADDVYLRKFTGAAYPVPEKSGFKTKTISFDAAFREAAEVEAFEALIGKIVCVKRGRTAITGVLSSATKKITEFYASFSCSVSQIHFDEEVAV